MGAGGDAVGVLFSLGSHRCRWGPLGFYGYDGAGGRSGSFRACGAVKDVDGCGDEKQADT